MRIKKSTVMNIYTKQAEWFFQEGKMYESFVNGGNGSLPPEELLSVASWMAESYLDLISPQFEIPSPMDNFNDNFIQEFEKKYKTKI